MTLLEIYLVVGIIISSGRFLEDIIFNKKQVSEMLSDDSIPTGLLLFGAILAALYNVVFWPQSIFRLCKKAFYK